MEPGGGATGYTVYRAYSLTGVWISAGTVSGLSKLDDGIAGNTTVYYKVAAYNAGGSSPLSTPAVSATTSAIVLRSIVDLFANTDCLE